jgi:hypothetical protein
MLHLPQTMLQRFKMKKWGGPMVEVFSHLTSQDLIFCKKKLRKL